jgi:hypothetical protein
MGKNIENKRINQKICTNVRRQCCVENVIGFLIVKDLLSEEEYQNQECRKYDRELNQLLCDVPVPV